MSSLIVFILLGLSSQAAAQCSKTENTNCVNFVRNGYCNNMGYTLAQRQATCGISCGLCTSAGAPIVDGVCTGDANANCATWKANGFCNNGAYTQAQKLAYCCKSCATTPAAGVDGNANCKKWSEDDSNAFCASSTVSTEQKKSFCAKTCEFEIAPTAKCVLYTLTGTVLKRGTPTNATGTTAGTQGVAVASGGVTGTTTISRAYAAKGCTITLYNEAETSMPPYTPTSTKTFAGTDVPGTFHKITDVADQKALSYDCICPP